MSTFKGFLKDRTLDFIAIDFFDASTYDCTHFLLSHHHSDHTTGLFYRQFVERMNSSNDKQFICSPVTAHLLQRDNRFQIASEKMRVVDVNQSLCITHNNLETDLNITLLPAGHCPGSVMFLFEFDGKRILYTGDYRMNLSSVKRMKPYLANRDGSAISLTDLHIDTTFAIDNCPTRFPDREQSEEFISKKVKRWITEADNASKVLTVIIRLSAKYSVEFLYQCLYQKLKTPISVHDHDAYADVEEMAQCVIPMNSNRTWIIHACSKQRQFCSAYCRSDFVKILKPCVQSFLYDSNKNDTAVDEETGVPHIQRDYELKVFYATHPSLHELRDFVEYLKPSRIFANVVVNDTEEQIVNRLRNGPREVVSEPKIKPLLTLSPNIEYVRKRTLDDVLNENKRLNEKLCLRF